MFYVQPYSLGIARSIALKGKPFTVPIPFRITAELIILIHPIIVCRSRIAAECKQFYARNMIITAARCLLTLPLRLQKYAGIIHYTKLQKPVFVIARARIAEFKRKLRIVFHAPDLPFFACRIETRRYLDLIPLR